MLEQDREIQYVDAEAGRERLKLFIVRDTVNGAILYAGTEQGVAERTCYGERTGFAVDEVTGKTLWQSVPVMETHVVTLGERIGRDVPALTCGRRAAIRQRRQDREFAEIMNRK